MVFSILVGSTDLLHLGAKKNNQVLPWYTSRLILVSMRIIGSNAVLENIPVSMPVARIVFISD